MSSTKNKAPAGTTIVRIKNDSAHVAGFAAGSTQAVAWPNATSSVNLFMPGNTDNSCRFDTHGKRGTLWDRDWKIHGRYEGEHSNRIFLEGSNNGVSGNIEVTVKADGELALKKA